MGKAGEDTITTPGEFEMELERNYPWRTVFNLGVISGLKKQNYRAHLREVSYFRKNIRNPMTAVKIAIYLMNRYSRRFGLSCSVWLGIQNLQTLRQLRLVLQIFRFQHQWRRQILRH